MVTNVLQTTLGGVVASLVWFVVGGALYQNPLVAKIYKSAEGSPGLKKWSSVPTYIGLQYVGILAQCVLWAFIFVLVKPVLPERLVIRGLVFGLLLILTKIFPRFFDMWIQSTYPNKLLATELVNGAIGSLVIGAVFSYVL